MTKKTHNVIMAALVLACGAGLVVWAAADAQWMQTVSAQEVIDNLPVYRSKSLQVFGKVVPGSVKEQGQTLTFELYWPKEDEMAAQTLRVKYKGLSKVNLASGSEVLIDCGVDEQGLANATKILTKCPSKYKSRNAEDTK